MNRKETSPSPGSRQVGPGGAWPWRRPAVSSFVYLPLLVVFTLLCWLLRYLTPEHDLNRLDSAAALGVLLLGAALLGKIAERSRLPQITGFLIAGIVFGPYMGNVVRLPAVERLELVNRLALGLIALTAGGELRMAELRPTIRQVAWQVGLRFVVVPVVVGASAFLLLPAFGGPHWPSPIVGILASLLLGVVASAKSPSTTVAVINETRSQGPLTSRTLAAAVAIDVVVLVVFAPALALTRAAIHTAGSAHPNVFATVAWEILGALPIGLALGLITIWYLRSVAEDIPVFLLGVVFLATEVAHSLHTDPILACVIIGFLVENFSRQGERLIEGIEQVSLPIYAVFFAVAGAALDLTALRTAGLAAVVLVLARIAGTYLATDIAGRISGEEPRLRRLLWTGFIGQAGVSLGLAAILAHELPDPLGPALRTLIVASVVVNQVIGPVLFRFGLDKAGEIGARRRRY